MKIDISNETGVVLDSLMAGETFKYGDDYYIVTDERLNQKVLCVELTTGTLERIYEDETVERIKLKVVLDRDDVSLFRPVKDGD